MRSIWDVKDVVAGLTVTNSTSERKWNVPFIVSWVQAEDCNRLGLCCLTDGMAVYFDTAEELATYLTRHDFALCEKIIGEFPMDLPENRLNMPVVLITNCKNS